MTSAYLDSITIAAHHAFDLDLPDGTVAQHHRQ